MTKAERLDFGESLMTHAMVLTGVDIVDGQTTKWKVENSWGEKVGENGFFVMSDAWMDEYTYQIVVHKDLLTDEQKKLGNKRQLFGTLGSNGRISIKQKKAPPSGGAFTLAANFTDFAQCCIIIAC